MRIIVYAIILGLSMIGCEQPVKTIYVTAKVPEERVVSDFTVKPVEEYPAYYVGPSGKVEGVPSDSVTRDDLTDCPVIVTVDGEDYGKYADEFFIVAGDIFMKVSWYFHAPEGQTEGETIVKYCKQTGGKITYLTEAKFPTMPDPARVTGTPDGYTIKIGDYNSQVISVCQRGDDPIENLIMVDGYLPVSGGMLLHVQEGRGPSRPAGLLFWPENRNSMMLWKDPGRFWMM